MMSLLRNELSKFVGASCWHVSRGGATSPSFELALGRLIRRVRPLRNQNQPEIFRVNDSELGLLVWCSWRLIDGSKIVASSCEGGLAITELDRLIGRRVTKIEAVSARWDLNLEFDSGSRLDIFCDRPATQETLPDNWELWTQEREVDVGPGLDLRISERRFDEG